MKTILKLILAIFEGFCLLVYTQILQAIASGILMIVFPFALFFYWMSNRSKK